MILKIVRKSLVILIIILPVFTDLGCRKQAKCGCGKDVLFDLDREQASVYFTESTATFSPISNPYSTYYFCNPGEMYPKLAEYKSGDVLLVSGHVYWECNYLYQSSNYSYQSYYKVYNIQVTEVTTDLYGKK
jgi:hypothetical protein